MPTLLEVSASLLISFIISEALSSDYRNCSAQHRRWCTGVIVCLTFVVCVCALGRNDKLWHYIDHPDLASLKNLSRLVPTDSYFVPVCKKRNGSSNPRTVYEKQTATLRHETIEPLRLYYLC